MTVDRPPLHSQHAPRVRAKVLHTTGHPWCTAAPPSVADTDNAVPSGARSNLITMTMSVLAYAPARFESGRGPQRLASAVMRTHSHVGDAPGTPED